MDWVGGVLKWLGFEWLRGASQHVDRTAHFCMLAERNHFITETACTLTSQFFTGADHVSNNGANRRGTAVGARRQTTAATCSNCANKLTSKPHCSARATLRHSGK